MTSQRQSWQQISQPEIGMAMLCLEGSEGLGLFSPEYRHLDTNAPFAEGTGI